MECPTSSTVCAAEGVRAVPAAIFFGILGDQPRQHTFTHATSASLWYLAASCAAAIACCLLAAGHPAAAAPAGRPAVPRECHESVTPGR